MYALSVPVFDRYLGNLINILDKGAAYAAERKIDDTVLTGMRIYPDMLPMLRQIMIAADFAKGASARLAGVEVPKYEDSRRPLPSSKARCQKTRDFLATLKPEQFDGAENRTINITIAGAPAEFVGLPYLTGFALPNFYFHATTAYNLLRQPVCRWASATSSAVAKPALTGSRRTHEIFIRTDWFARRGTGSPRRPPAPGRPWTMPPAEKAVIRITEANGVFTGKIEKLLDPAKQDSKCDECTDDRKGKPVSGSPSCVTSRKAKATGRGGDILDAANGKVYRVRLSLSADNKSWKCGATWARRCSGGRKRGREWSSSFWANPQPNWAKAVISSNVDNWSFCHLRPHRMGVSAKS